MRRLIRLVPRCTFAFDTNLRTAMKATVTSFALSFLFVSSELPAQIPSKVVQRDVFFLKALLKFVLGKARFELIQLAVDLVIGSDQTQLFSPLHHDFIVDQVAKDAEPEAVGRFAAGLLRRAGGLIRIIFFNLGAGDRPAVYFSNHIAASSSIATAIRHKKRYAKESRSEQTK